MVYIAYFTELNLQICTIMRKNDTFGFGFRKFGLRKKSVSEHLLSGKKFESKLWSRHSVVMTPIKILLKLQSKAQYNIKT